MMSIAMTDGRAALANIDCEVSDTIDRYSHGLFIGLVKAVRVSTFHKPQLVYQHGVYGAYPQFVKTSHGMWRLGE